MSGDRPNPCPWCPEKQDQITQLKQENEQLMGVLRKISHNPQYDGQLCDKEDCPNCIAQKVLKEIAVES